MLRLITVLLASSLCASEYTSDIEKWRQQRETRLKAPDGWLSVAGLVWLKQGDNHVDVGSRKSCDTTCLEIRFRISVVQGA